MPASKTRRRPTTPEDIERARRNTARTTGYARTIESIRTCPETGAAVVIGLKRLGRADVQTAYGFKPGVFRRIEAEWPVETAHERLNALNAFLDRLRAEKARKVAAHDLKVGEIVAEIWGFSMRDVRFYRVVDIPHPRKVTLSPLEDRIASGDWVSGTKVPVDGPIGPEAPRHTCPVSMESGAPDIRTGSTIARTRRWDGTPVQIFCD